MDSGRVGVWLRRFHLAAAIIWGALIVPTVLIWRKSILWIALMSVYAIVISHWSAYQAGRAETENGNDPRRG